jgi:diguanylate cyclase (GGDEF)-like protein/PAS domain S-box-containing protein
LLNSAALRVPLLLATTLVPMPSAGEADGPGRTLTVASSNNFPPVNFLDQDGHLTGFGRELSDAALAQLGVSVRRRHSASWLEVLQWLEDGDADLIHDAAYTKARDTYLDFSVPILELPEVIFVRDTHLTIRDLASLNGKWVACVRAHISHLYLQTMPEIHCHVVETPAEGIYALVSGDVDAFVYPKEIVEFYTQRLRLTDKLKIVGEPLRTLVWSMAVRDGDSALLAELNRAITQLKASGEYDRLYTKWFGRRLLSGYSAPELYTLVVVAALLGLMVSGVAILFLDNRRVRKARLALQQSEERYRLLVENQSDLIVKVDTAGRFLFVSPSYCDMFGLPRDSLLGKTYMPFVHEEDRLATAQAIEQLSASPYSAYVEQRAMTKDGLRWLGWQDTAVLGESNEVVAIIGVGRDITARKAAEAAQQESELRLRIAGELAYDLIYEWSVADESLTWFGDLDRALGYDKDAISRGASFWLSLIHPQDAAPLTHVLQLRGTPSDPLHLEYRIQHRSGRYLHWSDQCVPMLDEHGRAYKWLGVCKDITTQKDQQRALEYIAHFDTLTDLPNRVLLMVRLRQAMARERNRGGQLALVYLDVDGFKQINDRYGHEVGDRFLAELATCLKHALRGSDSIARVGGDEFVAMLLDAGDADECAPMLERLLRAAAEPVRVGDLVLRVTASLGVTFYPQSEDTDADLLLRQADQALYQAKLLGKNRYHIFDAAEDRSVRGRHEEVQRISEALDSSELVIEYQPCVNMRTGEVYGVEALLRWQHPERGLLAPACFLPLVQTHPLMSRLGDWVLGTALAQMEAWSSAGLDLRISVNVAAWQLQDTGFVAHLEALFAAHPRADPRRLQLEVLESAALEDLAQVSRIMRDCAAMGVHFALDDFGTGYSSLTYLQRLPVRTLKLDQTFVQGMLEDPDDLIILEGVLRMGTGLGREVIAEGVETREQGELLLKIGCERAQGFGIARPMPARDVPQWCRTWRTHDNWREQRPIEQDDLPLLLASISHRAWMRALENYLRLRAVKPPPMRHRDCAFGHWLKRVKQARYGGSAGCAALVALHGDIHRTADHLYALRLDGQQEPALVGLDRLKGESDALISHIEGLLAAPRRSTAPDSASYAGISRDFFTAVETSIETNGAAE